MQKKCMKCIIEEEDALYLGESMWYGVSYELGFILWHDIGFFSWNELGFKDDDNVKGLKDPKTFPE